MKQTKNCVWQLLDGSLAPQHRMQRGYMRVLWVADHENDTGGDMRSNCIQNVGLDF